MSKFLRKCSALLLAGFWLGNSSFTLASPKLLPPVAGHASIQKTNETAGSSLVISQVYGGGGNSGATYKQDFVELFNPTAAVISVDGWSIQYASAAGSSWSKTNLSGTIQPGQYFLIQLAAGAGGSVSLPTPDATGTLNLSGTTGKLALVSNQTVLTGTCPTGLVDFVGFGSSANCSENTPTATLSNSTAAIRASNGCTDTNDNAADFTIGAPTPRNSTSPVNNCSGTNPGQPVVTTSIAVNPEELTLAPTLVNKTSASASYTLSATELTGDVNVAATDVFEISKDNVNFSKNLLFTPAELSSAQTVYVRFTPVALSTYTGSITHSINGTNISKVVKLSGAGFDPYAQNFNDPAFLTNSGWTQYSVTGAQIWASTNFGSDCLVGCNAATPNKAAQINGYASGNQSNEDWLISAPMNLSGFVHIPVLQFQTISAYAGDQLSLKYSTDYSGSGNPNAATWTEVPGVFPASNSNTWILSQGIELPKANKIYVAFVYTSITSAASRWTVDDFQVQDVSSYYVIPNVALNFGEAASGTTSVSQSFNFRTVNYGDITLTAPVGYQLSADNGSTFAAEVKVSEAQAAAGKEILVRFAPTTKELKITGQITFSGTDLNVTGIALSGSSYLKSETFDVATYNLEFFASDVKDGSSEFGPVDDALQVANVTKVMQALNADVIGIEELSEEGELDNVLTQMPGYAKVISDRYSYSFEPADPTFPLQKIGFVYNTNTMQLKGKRVMFEKLFDDIRSGAATIANYPGGSASSLWSSGRLPFMAIFDATINGVTKRIRVIDIHAKSGSAAADYNRRQFDVKMLQDSLNTYYPNDNIILVGDYNDDVDTSIKTGSPSSYKNFVDDIANFNALTYPISVAGAISFVSSSSFLDHIIISNELNDEYIPGSIAVEDARAYIANYASSTSDHLPVYARFAFAGKDNQIISDFTLIKDVTFGVAPITLSAFSNSRLPVSFEVVQGPATIAGNILTITGAGTVSIRAVQAGDEAYNAATAVEQTFTVAKASQTITFAPMEAKTYGDAPFTLAASSSAGLDITYTVVSGLAKVSGNVLTLTGAGQVVIRATQAGNTNYLAAAAEEQTFCVNASKPVFTVQNAKNLTANTVPGITAYQWFRNGLVIPDATAQAYVATEGGNYTVMAIAGNCSSVISDAQYVSFAGVPDMMQPVQVNIFPNPVTDRINIQIQGAGAGQVIITLYNQSGNVALSKTMQSNTADFEMVVEVSQLPKGIYMLVVTTPNGLSRTRLILK